MQPLGPFNLLNQNKYFNGWPTLKSDPTTIVMAFAVDGDWSQSAAVTVQQKPNGDLDIAVYGTADPAKAQQQALAALSLDEDGLGWQEVGKRDDFVAGLQREYQYMRPSLFNSAYEAAAGFIIGHRITIVQARKIRSSMAEELGNKIDVAGESFYAFPSPQNLLALEEYKGLSEAKVTRLHAVAEATLAGKLDRAHLRQLSDDTALAELETLPGIGPFFSQGILYRGVGKQDGFTQDDMTFHAIITAYGLSKNAPVEEMLAIANRWQPYRMWVIVLLHVWLRETGNFPKRERR